MRSSRWGISFILCSWAALHSQTTDYWVSFLQVYHSATSFAAPDSVDIYLLIEKRQGAPNDTLASSNFPFFYNSVLLNMAGARVLHERRFSSQTAPTYYDPITWSVSAGRVNVTIRRKIGYAPNGGHLINSLDTLFGLRVPLYACGPQLRSVLIWDSVPAAVLNHNLQDLKQRLDWVGPDTLDLCPPATATASPLGISPTPPVCTQIPVTFTFTLTNGISPADSFTVNVKEPGGAMLSYPNIVSLSGTQYVFTLPFYAEGNHTISLFRVDRKCRCIQPLRDTTLQVFEPLPSLPIVGPDTVYVGGPYTYSLPSSSPSTTGHQWYYIYGSTQASLGTALSQPVSFALPPPALPRVDTLIVTYRYTGNPCGVRSQKTVVVQPCPPPADAIARTPVVCRGQRGLAELINLAPRWDSIRWQYWIPNSWNDLPDGVGFSPTAPLYITPPLTQGPLLLRARVHYGPCRVESSADTIWVVDTFLVRGFNSLTNPVCVGDTSWLYAVGPGVWLTPDGQGSFTDTLDPRGGYVPHPNDVGNVRICWVIRSQDLGICRDPSQDTLCFTLGVQGSNAQGSFSAPVDTICAGAATPSLNGQIISGTRGFWASDGQGFFSPSADDPQARYVSAQRDTARWVHLEWVVVGTCGRQVYRDSVYIRPGFAAEIVGPNQLCANVGLTLQAQITTGFDSLWWFRGSLVTVLAAGPLSRSNPRFIGEGSPLSIGALPVGRDTFLLYGRTGGCESIDELPIEVLPAPTAFFDATPRITTMNSSTVTFTSQSQGAISHVWNFGDPNQPSVDSVPNPTFSYSAPGTYTVVLYVQNALGCSDFYVCTNCIQVLPRRVYLPNAFSPNGDGKNDVFRILPLTENFRFTRLEVFDRWGQPVFSGDDLLEWDGRGEGGKPLDPGTYSYRALILIPDEGLVTHTGVVHIVR